MLRRAVTRGLTKNIGHSASNYTIDPAQKITITKILISRPNHRLGNLLLITPLVQDVTTSFPDCKIDLFVKGGLAPIIFQNYDNIKNIIELPKKPFKDLIAYFKIWVKIKSEKYDIVINVDKNSSSGRLSAQFANAKYKFFGEEDQALRIKYPDYDHIAKFPVYEFRSFLNKLGLPEKNEPIPPLDIKLTAAELEKGKTIVNALMPNDKETICIFTFATADKCYSTTWWEEFYMSLKLEFSNYNILEILPVENVSQINFKATSFYSKDVREIAAVVANTKLFIGADSGIMHLASAGLTPTIGLFSRPNIDIYKPYHNNSIAINTNVGTVKDWITAVKKVVLIIDSK